MCGLVLGLMAISASGAQATGMWMVNGSNVGAGVELKFEANVKIEPLKIDIIEGKEVELEKHLLLLTTSGANKVEILCEVISAVKGVIKLEEITGTLNIEKCKTILNGKAEPNCNPTVEPIKGGGKAFAALHEVEGKKLPYAKAEGTGGVFATFNFSEEKCVALSPAEKITGIAWIEDCKGEFEKESPTHLIQEAKVPAEKLGGLFFGGNKAVIHGSVIVSLSDAEHLNKPFSGLAE